jgi:sugar phosphate isomerase/epimerase
LKGKPQDYMKVGLVHFMAFPECIKGEGPVVETLQKVCDDDYFQAVEVTHIADAGARKAAIEACKSADMSVGFAAQPVLLIGGHDLNSLCPEKRRASVDAVRDCLEEANEWEADALTLLSGKDVAEDDRRMAKSMLMASIKEICEFSRRSSKMPIILETFDRQPFGKNCLIGPTDEAGDIADQIEPYFHSFGLCLDLSHLPLLGETADEALKAATPYIRGIHIGNCVMKDAAHPAYGDEHPPFGVEGGENGVDELCEFLKALLEAGYIGEGMKNAVTIEVKPMKDQTSDEAISLCKTALDAAWAAI